MEPIDTESYTNETEKYRSSIESSGSSISNKSGLVQFAQSLLKESVESIVITNLDKGENLMFYVMRIQRSTIELAENNNTYKSHILLDFESGQIYLNDSPKSTLFFQQFTKRIKDIVLDIRTDGADVLEELKVVSGEEPDRKLPFLVESPPTPSPRDLTPTMTISQPPLEKSKESFSFDAAINDRLTKLENDQSQMLRDIQHMSAEFKGLKKQIATIKTALSELASASSQPQKNQKSATTSGTTGILWHELDAMDMVFHKTLLASTQHLDLSHCPSITDEQVLAMLSFMSNLQSINVQGCARLSDNTFFSMSEKSSRLVYLNLEDCTQVSAQSLLAFAEKSDTLTDLILTKCIQCNYMVVKRFIPKLTKHSHIILPRYPLGDPDKNRTLRSRFSHLELV